MATPINAPALRVEPMSVTRQMAASLPKLRAIAEQKGLAIHHLGAGYPHPEVTDPRKFLEHKANYYQQLEEAEGVNDPDALPEFLRESYAYTDTLGPKKVRDDFAAVYGNDIGATLNPAKLLPTVGATGGINLMCSLFERPGQPLAFITDAPTYAGFVARAGLCQYSSIYSVDMDEEGPVVAQFEAQIAQARADGRYVPFYYTVPDGHNPAGFSFSPRRRQALVDVARAAGILIVEDAPYFYINYQSADERAPSFLSLAPELTVHLFTGSKIGFPGPRVAFLYTDAELAVDSGADTVALSDLLLTEASGDVLFQNPEALLGFSALLHDESLTRRTSLWPVAEEKLVVYRENREIMMTLLTEQLGAYPEHFSWTSPGAGFFTVFTFKNRSKSHIVRTDDQFVADLVANYGVVVIPMYDFYPDDARERDADAGLDQLRLSFCFSESTGDQRRADLTAAVTAFCVAAKAAVGLDESGS